jgi:RNA polymerase sigma-70 factor (ECF subfamily)
MPKKAAEIIEEEKVLIEAFNNGDRSAFDKLVKPHVTNLTNLTRSLISNRADAEELFQDTLEKANRALPNFKGDSQFYTWLFRIAVNGSCNFHAREKRKRRRLHDSFEYSSEAYSNGELDDSGNGYLMNETFKSSPGLFYEFEPEYSLRYDQLREILLQAIEDVEAEATKPGYTRPFVMFTFEGISNYEEIAENEGISIGTVKSRINRTREKVAHKVELRGGLEKGSIKGYLQEIKRNPGL